MGDASRLAMIFRWGLGLAVGLAAASASAKEATEGAETASTPPLRPYNGLLSLGPTLGFHAANGLAVHLGSRYGLIVSGGYAPVLATFLRNRTESVFRLYHAGQLDADLKLELWESKTRIVLGFRPGYRYSTVLGHGVQLGGYVGKPLSEHVTLDISYGLSVFAGGAERIERERGLPYDADFGPLSPWLQGGLSAALLWSL